MSSSATMSIESICGSNMNRALTEYGESVAKSVINALSVRYGFSSEEACSLLSVSLIEKCRKSRPVSRETRVVRTSLVPSSLPLPFCGKAVSGWCYGIRSNGGLFTQCSQEPADGDTPYCNTCRRQSEKNERDGGVPLPNGGDIGERIAKGAEWRCPKGKEPIRLANYLKMKKIELTSDLRDELIKEASDPKFGWKIPDDEWKVKTGSRGRPRKTKTAIVDTTSTEDEGDSSKSLTNKKRKTKPVSETELLGSDSSDGEELVLATPMKSSVVKRRESHHAILPVESNTPNAITVVPNMSIDDNATKHAENTEATSWSATTKILVMKEAAAKSANVISPVESDTSNAISPIVMEPEKTKRKPKMSPDEKAAKAKRLDCDAKLAEKEAKLAEKEAAKAAKLAEKEAAKAAKLAEKEASKAAKLAEKVKSPVESDTPNAISVVPNISLDEKATNLPDNTSELVVKDEAAELADDVVAQLDRKEQQLQAMKEADKELGLEVTPELYESETDDEEDAAGVEEFLHKGKTYLRDPGSNDIFDHAIFMETGEAEEVGTYNPEADTIVFLE